MYDRDLTREIINQVHQSVMLVIARFEPVKSVNDFRGSPEGMEKLDAV